MCFGFMRVIVFLTERITSLEVCLKIVAVLIKNFSRVLQYPHYNFTLSKRLPNVYSLVTCIIQVCCVLI